MKIITSNDFEKKLKKLHPDYQKLYEKQRQKKLIETIY